MKPIKSIFKGIRIGLDIDDTLAECNGYALRLLNEKFGTKFELHDLFSWGSDAPAQERLEYFCSPEFVRSQPLYPGAKEFVLKLLAMGAEVFFVTSVPSSVYHARVEWIKDNFPEVPEKNIIMAGRKDVILLDVILDDAPHNILNSIAKYPILFRRPWNAKVTGLPSVNSYDDALNLIETIIRSGGYSRTINEDPNIFCLVAPSGSGKTEVIEELCKTDKFDVPVIFTTGDRKQSYYRKVTPEGFRSLNLAEATSYAGDSYGITTVEIEKLLSLGKSIVIPLDICGANALRRIYGDKVATVFISRDKESLVSNILKKSITDECKVCRILALDSEIRNSELCDIITESDMTAKEIADMICGL